MTRLRLKWDEIQASYWYVPTLMAIGATFIYAAAIQLERTLGRELVESLGWTYTGDADAARGVLSAIAGTVMTVAGTTFSITIAALSLASSQFGPRLIRSFMKDKGNQIVLGTFTSTFLYCLLVLRTIRGNDTVTFVPQLAVTIGVAFAVLSVGVLIYFIHHAAESIQVGHLIGAVGRDIDASFDRNFPERPEKTEPEPVLPSMEPSSLLATSSGYVHGVDFDAIVREAALADIVVHSQVQVGDYVIEDTPLLLVWPGASEELRHSLVNAIALGITRTSHQDPRHAVMQLTEIAVRALSPSINDPFTASACVDRLTSSLARLEKKHLPSAGRGDEKGELRLVTEPVQPSTLVRTAFRPIIDNAATQPMVVERIKLQLEFLLNHTSNAGTRDAIRVELGRLPIET